MQIRVVLILTLLLSMMATVSTQRKKLREKKKSRGESELLSTTGIPINIK